MRYELFDFQKEAVNKLLKSMGSMQRNYSADGTLSAVSLIAPTGAGKTVIAAAVAEGLFCGNDAFPGDTHAVILWLSDSPSLNEQTMKRFEAATDMLNGVTSMEVIGSEFAKNHKYIYFLNRQLLGKGKRLSNEAEGGRSFYDVLNDTIEDDSLHLYLFIDEAHRGLGTSEKDKGTSDSDNTTIYSIIIDGQDGINKPMPCVIGISATPERFKNAMQGRVNRDMKADVNVPVSDVQASGLIKNVIELRTPKKFADMKHQDLVQACTKLAFVSKQWEKYCVTYNVFPVVVPLMVVQVEDKVTNDTLSSLCEEIHKVLPWLDITDCFGNVFGEHEDIDVSLCKIPYVKPDEVSGMTNIRVLFAKDAVSTGWDCPRAEVIYSRRKRTDPTYIAQLIGRMIRTPLARRVDEVEELNAVACYLPEFDAETVDSVVERLKADNVAIEPNKVLKNPADVAFFGQMKAKIEQQIAKKQGNTNNGLYSGGAPVTTANGVSTGTTPVAPSISSGVSTGFSAGSDEYSVNTDEYEVDYGDAETETIDELQEVLDRMPKVDADEVKASFEGIITRQIRYDKFNYFLDLWNCVDIILSDLNPDDAICNTLSEDFYNNVEGEIQKHHTEFNRTLYELKSTTVVVKRVDPLTGVIFGNQEELIDNDDARLKHYYEQAIYVFADASDLINSYIKKRQEECGESETNAISRISAVGSCMEVVRGLEEWAEGKIRQLMDIYGPSSYGISVDNKAKWDRIEGNMKLYVERNLNIQSVMLLQNKDCDRYPKHIISDTHGWAYLKLNGFEKVVVNTELANPLTVAFYRNPSRNSNAALSIPYELNGQWGNMYPDFIFFVRNGNNVARAIVDPHGDWLGDSVAKLKGYVAYIKDYPDMFVKVLVVADTKDGEYRYLNLMLESVQDAIEQFSGSSAKELFNGPLSQRYYVKTV